MDATQGCASQQLWDSEEPGTDLLLVPSFDADPRTLGSISGLQSWPERQLIELRHLRTAGNRLFLITPVAISEACLDAVLELIPSAPASWLRRRLQLINLNDPSAQPLTQKVLERPQLMAQLRHELRPGSVLAAYAVGEAEMELAERLGLKLEGSASALAPLGTKAGSAAVFAELGLPHPATSGLCNSLHALQEAINELVWRDPTIEAVLVKLNCMAGGRGNAPLPLALTPWRRLPARQRSEQLAQALATLPMPLAHWRDELRRHGALAQALIAPEAGLRQRRLSSPSVQLWIEPNGSVQVLSSHEQLLAGPHGFSFAGCRFPARAAYRPALLSIGRRLGAHLARLGCRGPVLLDLLAHKDPMGWRLWAIEINLRKGGTSHPFQLAATVAGGGCDPESGLLLSSDGRPLFYEASDAIAHPGWRGLLIEQLLDGMVRRGLYIDTSRMSGCIPHRLGALGQHGLLGVTALGRSRLEAARLMQALQVQYPFNAAEGWTDQHPDRAC